MKSRPDILEELDIKCWQLAGVAVYLDVGKDIMNIMVKVAGVIFILFASATASIVKLPKTYALEKIAEKQIYNIDGSGTYSFEYVISDGSYRAEDGGIITNSAGVRGLVVRGEYGFIDPDGLAHSIKYVADSNGYRPQSVDTDTRFNDRRIV